MPIRIPVSFDKIVADLLPSIFNDNNTIINNFVDYNLSQYLLRLISQVPILDKQCDYGHDENQQIQTHINSRHHRSINLYRCLLII
jgi:hypothetical protein